MSVLPEALHSPHCCGRSGNNPSTGAVLVQPFPTLRHPPGHAELHAAHRSSPVSCPALPGQLPHPCATTPLLFTGSVCISLPRALACGTRLRGNSHPLLMVCTPSTGYFSSCHHYLFQSHPAETEAPGWFLSPEERDIVWAAGCRGQSVIAFFSWLLGEGLLSAWAGPAPVILRAWGEDGTKHKDIDNQSLFS